jgi:hypothetical protein
MLLTIELSLMAVVLAQAAMLLQGAKAKQTPAAIPCPASRRSRLGRNRAA